MPKKKTGRPQLDIPEEEVYKLAGYGCPNSEIADFFGCAESTIGERFRSILVKARAEMKQKLRRKQFEMAEGGDRTMLVWLGKNMLGQSDALDINANLPEVNVTINANYVPTQPDGAE